MMIWFFERFPYLEVFVRLVYKKFLELGILKNRVVPNEKAENIEKVDINELTKVLEQAGIKKGDVLIVHSSLKGIKGFGLNAEEIINYLIEYIGDEGLLLMPTYPDYPSFGYTLSFDEYYDETFVYDVKNTNAWTGYITNVFKNRDDVYRSHYPNNTLAARGNDKEQLFITEHDMDLAFDKKSAWRYCVDHHAKVLFLGIHAHHSLSEIHIAEDYLDDKWPIKGWYTSKKYKVIADGVEHERTCRVRKNFWTKYMTEYYGCYRLRKEGLLEEGKIVNINYSIVPDLFNFEKYVEECAKKGDLLYFRIPKKYRKRIV